MIVSIAELVYILGQMLQGDFVILTDNAALKKCPKAFNRVGVPFTDNISRLGCGNPLLGAKTNHGTNTGYFISDII